MQPPTVYLGWKGTHSEDGLRDRRELWPKKGGSTESNFTGRSGHTSLIRPVMVGSHAPGIQLYSKNFIFAFSKPCPWFL